MKLISVIAITLALTACNGSSAITNNNQNAKPSKEQQMISKRVNELIQEAKETGDTRLLATSGRKTTIPGLSQEEISKVELCGGYRYFKNTGDEITSQEQRESRKFSVEVMTEYNQIMLKNCKIN